MGGQVERKAVGRNLAGAKTVSILIFLWMELEIWLWRMVPGTDGPWRRGIVNRPSLFAHVPNEKPQTITGALLVGLARALQALVPIKGLP